MAIVERVDEVEADVARNQFKARRAPPRGLVDFFRFGQDILRFWPNFYYLTIKTLLTS
jgi:hypothetical protein